MVKKESPVYLFVGEDAFLKDAKVKKLKEQFLAKDTEQFNLDVLYARELNLKSLQERLLCLPVRVKRRVIVIKQAEGLKADTKEFISSYVRNPYEWVILVLDIDWQEPKDEFIKRISGYSEVCRFKQTARPDAFLLAQRIDLKEPEYALRLLSQLLKNGEKPERLLGGLRYSWERQLNQPLKRRKRLKAILDCDIDIKTGRLKACFALERLVVSLCCLS